MKLDVMERIFSTGVGGGRLGKFGRWNILDLGGEVDICSDHEGRIKNFQDLLANIFNVIKKVVFIQKN